MEFDDKQLQKLHEAFADFKVLNERALAEIEKYGKVSGDLDVKMTTISDSMDTIETKINTRLAEVEAKAAKAEETETKLREFEAEVRSKGSKIIPGGDDQKAVRAMRSSIFWKLTRGGVGHDALDLTPLLTEEEKQWVSTQKALIVGDDTQGGYLAPEEYVSEIIKDQLEFSPIRTVARIRTTSRRAINIPKKTGSIAATWVEETGTRADSGNPTYGMERLDTFEMHGLIKVSRQELEDAVFNIEGFIREELSEQFGVAEGTAFVSGNAIGRPEGILSNASVATVNSGHASQITADGLIDLYFSPKEVYIANAYWLMGRSTLKAIRKLKDGSGAYIWSAGIKSDARPASILDRPYLVCTDMPAIAGDAYPVAFGDFRRGYYILDRVLMEIMTDPYSSKSTGLIEISARKRVGGRVVLPEAIKKQKIAA